MATKYWIGGATAIAQVASGSIDSVDGTPANNTFTVTVGGVAISVVGDTDTSTTAGNLRTALTNAATSTDSTYHPYFGSITWGGSGANVTATAPVAGVPFEATLSVSGAGTGTITNFADTTASQGATDAGVGANYSDGSVPGAADTLIIADTSQPIRYNLDALTAVTIALLRVDKTMTGKIGLANTTLATEENGTTSTTTVVGADEVPEYRTTYLEIGWDRAEIGQHYGPGSPTFASMIKLNNKKSGASDTIIYDTHSSGEAQRAAVQLLAAHANADVFVRSCPGGVGFATGVPGETATFGDITISTTNSAHPVECRAGVTLTNWVQAGGNCSLKAAATVTAATVEGGTLRTEGSAAITTLDGKGGTCDPNSTGTVTTLNLTGGILDLRNSDEARTITTLNLTAGTLRDNTAVTITNYTRPTSDTDMTLSSALG